MMKKRSATVAVQPVRRPVNLGDKFLVLSTRAELRGYQPAEIIERRLILRREDIEVESDEVGVTSVGIGKGKGKGKGTDKEKVVVVKLENEGKEKIVNDKDYEFYVHYAKTDRRLDEWVTIDKIDLNYDASDSFGDDSFVKNKKMRRKSFASGDGTESKLHLLEKEHEELTKVRNIETIEFADFAIGTWYYSPFPEQYTGHKLYVCNYCLKYMKGLTTYRGHQKKCEHNGPPGIEIYREGNLSMWEVEGKGHKLYCQNLCLLSKLFLDHKTLYYDVDPFFFYVLCERDACGKDQIVGYFSKEKFSQENYNLACILTFPPFQRKGYGKFLISMSYELTKIEGKTGSPEKPLSDLGRISYRSYWTYVLLTELLNRRLDKELSVETLCAATGIRQEDLLSTFDSLNVIKTYKGQHVLGIQQTRVEELLSGLKGMHLCNTSLLKWAPHTTSPRSFEKSS